MKALAALAAVASLVLSAPAPAPVALLSGQFEPESSALLTRLDPLTLERVGDGVPLGEYAGAWSFSPDGTQLAIATAHDDVLVRSPAAARHIPFGLTILDTVHMRRVLGVRLGVSPTALGWLEPQRVAAYVPGLGFALIDPTTGAITRTIRISGTVVASAQTFARLVALLVPLGGFGPVRLVTIGAAGRARSVVLRRIRLAQGTRAALALDPAGTTAYVFGPGTRSASVSLARMRVRYHRALLPSKGRPDFTSRRASWVGDGAVAVTGVDTYSCPTACTQRQVGVALVDTRTWRVRMLDTHAGHALVADGRVLVYGGAGGVNAYAPDGSRVNRLLADARVDDVQSNPPYLYVTTSAPRRVLVVDAASGAILREVPAAPAFWLLSPRSA